MPVSIDAKWEKPRGATLALRAVSTAYTRDLAAAINRTQREASTDVAQVLRDSLTVRSRSVKRGVSLRARATPSRPAADIGISARSTFLSDFSFRGTKRSGVSVRVYKSKGSSRLRDAFVLRFKSGRRAIAQRGGKDSERPRLKSGRLGNVLLFSVSLARAIQQPGNAAEINSRVSRRLVRNVRRQARLALRRRLGKSVGGRALRGLV